MSGMEHPLIRFQSEHRLTQGELAERIGIGQSALSRLCSGKRSPRMDTMQRIREATGISLDEWARWAASQEETGSAAQ
jgi:transcriptional regulator with XRE-family HTH domain